MGHFLGGNWDLWITNMLNTFGLSCGGLVASHLCVYALLSCNPFYVKLFRGRIFAATIEEIEAEKSSIEKDVVSLS